MTVFKRLDDTDGESAEFNLLGNKYNITQL